jgi:hypothetical protein
MMGMGQVAAAAMQEAKTLRLGCGVEVECALRSLYQLRFHGQPKTILGAAGCGERNLEDLGHRLHQLLSA